jgi:hypothetical protein
MRSSTHKDTKAEQPRYTEATLWRFTMQYAGETKPSLEERFVAAESIEDALTLAQQVYSAGDIVAGSHPGLSNKSLSPNPPVFPLRATGTGTAAGK